MGEDIQVSIVMPCLNEEKSISVCVHKAWKVLRENNVQGEVVVVDNGSTDRSVAMAKEGGARVVFETSRGYGNAYRKGFSMARGQYIISADSDNSYDFGEVIKILEELKNGFDFVIGSRLRGKIHDGAMPWHHRYIGNPVLSWVLNVLFGTHVSDSHSGMRGFTRQTYRKMDLKTSGMELTSELILNASLNHLRIKEVPISYYPRIGKTKLRSFADGWRHLRFMLLYSPNVVFIIPSLILFMMGMLMELNLITIDIGVGRITFGPVTMLLAALLSIIGYQTCFLGIFAKDYMVQNNFLKKSSLVEKVSRHFTLERGILVGGFLILSSLTIIVSIVLKWIQVDFDDLSFDDIEVAIFAVTLFIFGVQTMFSSFLLSILKIK